MATRKERKKIDPEKVDILKPLDIFSLGSDDDPCFGKLHDLKAEECKVCGDSDFCAIVMSQNLHKERLKIEATQKFKDIDEAEEVMIEKKKSAKIMIKKLNDNGIKKMKVILRVSKKYNLTKDVVKELYNQI